MIIDENGGHSHGRGDRGHIDLPVTLPSCPTASGHTSQVLGRGFLDPIEFEKFLRDNPQVREVELSNYGEVFLHPRLAEIFETSALFQISLKAAGVKQTDNRFHLRKNSGPSDAGTDLYLI